MATLAVPLRPDPVTDTEVIGWFREGMPRGPIPSAEHLTPFIALVRAHHQYHFNVNRVSKLVASARPSRGQADTRLPAPGAAGAALDLAFALRTALDALAAFGDDDAATTDAADGTDHGFWIVLGMPPGGMSKLHAALTELGSSLRPRTKKKKRSPESWNDYADMYARTIASALRAAGWPNPSEDQVGPVARIGIRAIERVLGVKAQPTSFASAVRAQRSADGT